MAKKKESVIDVYSKMAEMRERRLSLEKEVNGLKEIEKSLQGVLKELVPDGEERDGVEHKVFDKVSVKYADYTKGLIAEFIPKTKRAEAEELKEEYTKKTTQHSFKLVGSK